MTREPNWVVAEPNHDGDEDRDRNQHDRDLFHKAAENEDDRVHADDEDDRLDFQTEYCVEEAPALRPEKARIWLKPMAAAMMAKLITVILTVSSNVFFRTAKVSLP